MERIRIGDLGEIERQVLISFGARKKVIEEELEQELQIVKGEVTKADIGKSIKHLCNVGLLRTVGEWATGYYIITYQGKKQAKKIENQVN